VVLTALLSINHAFAQNSTNPVIMKIGLEFMNIGKIDKETGSYEVTFWVSETSDNYDFTKQPPLIIDYENGYASEIFNISIEPHFYKFKVRGTFYNEIDYRPHPFHHMDLVVHIKSVIPNTLDNLVFVVDEKYSGIRHEPFVAVPGWNLGEPYFFVSNQTYPWGEFSRFTAVVPVESSATSVFLKYLSPVILIALFAFSTYWIPAKYSDEKIEIIAATLIAAIFFHISFLTANIPTVHYLTLADKVMMSVYAVFAMCLFATLLHKKTEYTLKEKYTDIEEKKINKKFRIMTPLVAIMVFTIVQFL
jgi:hypothetical protein